MIPNRMRGNMLKNSLSYELKYLKCSNYNFNVKVVDRRMYTM